MTEPDRRPHHLLAIMALIRALKEAEEELRAELGSAAVAAGLRQATFDVTDGDARYGTVSLVPGSWSATVDDPDALVAFVAERYPTELRDVTRVDPAFLDKLLANPQMLVELVAERHPDKIIETTEVRQAFLEQLLQVATAHRRPVDAEGEPIPGIAVAQGKPRYRCTPTETALEQARRVLSGGPGVWALPKGESDAA